MMERIARLGGNARRRGFTLVELLIVVVVIAILAAITIVAYNGIQDRANFSSAQESLSTLHKAILMYYGVNDKYPNTSGAWLTYGTQGSSVVPSIVPTFISTMPAPPTTSFNGMWYYNSNGTDYKLLYLTPGSTLPSVQLNNNPLLDPVRPTRGWGYWTPGGSSF